MILKAEQFLQDSNSKLEEEIGRNRYILLSDLLPLLSLAQGRVLLSFGVHAIEKPDLNSLVFEKSFFSNVFACPPPSGKSGCTCCSPIRGVSLYGIEPPVSAVSHDFEINGTSQTFFMFKGSCPLFNGSCSLGGSAETFYKNVPLPCAISPGWSVRIRGNSAFVGRKTCRYGRKTSYSESKFQEDLIVLERISAFLRSLSLEPAFSTAGLRKAFESQLL